MITYPYLKRGATVGVTAPSSGVSEDLYHLVHQGCDSLERHGYKTLCGETVWTQAKAKSAPATVRAAELMAMLRNKEINMILPPWGGELLIEILDHLDFDYIGEKWILGYSDTSALLLAITLKTGTATAHGTNLIDLRGEYWDETTAMWEKVLSTVTGSFVTQSSSKKYQKKWRHDAPSPCVFHLTEDTQWKTMSKQDVKVEGRLLGGCIDIIRHLIGTPYGNVDAFRAAHINDEPLIWYMENCELNTADLRRSLLQMKMAGWFENCSGILLGRSSANEPVGDYSALDVYKDLAEDLQIPIIYDVDCGHVPPQITFVNGAWAEVEVADGRGRVTQYFRP